VCEESKVRCDVSVREEDREGRRRTFNADGTPLAHDFQQANIGI
jgi:hypothetical protein